MQVHAASSRQAGITPRSGDAQGIAGLLSWPCCWCCPVLFLYPLPPELCSLLWRHPGLSAPPSAPWSPLKDQDHLAVPESLQPRLLATSICLKLLRFPRSPAGQARTNLEVRGAAALKSHVEQNNQRIFPKFINGGAGPGCLVMTLT